MIKKLHIPAALVFILFLSLGFLSIYHTKADVAVFYPSSCLGGWQNPHNAEGKPDADGSSGRFSDSNSASVGDSVADIFCGSFAGEIPKDSVPKKFFLKLSWSLGAQSAPKDNTDMAASAADALDAASSTASSTDAVSSPMDAASTTTATLDATPDSSLLVPADNPPSDNTPAPADVPPASDSAPSVAPDAPQSFLWKMIFSTALADEVNTSTDMLAAADAANTDSSSTPASAIDASSTASTTTTDESVNSPLLVISYTLDGVSWKELATVSSSNTQNTFEIPQADVSSWNDIANLQIKVSRIATLGTEPEVYLDAASLNVEYGKDPTPEESRSDKKRFDITDMQSSSDNLLLLASKNDSDQGNILVVRSYDSGVLYFFDNNDNTLSMTDGVSSEPTEFPAYQFELGHHMILFARNSADCSGKSFEVCDSLLDSPSKASFTVQPSANTPSEFLPSTDASTTIILPDASTTSSQ